MSGVRRSAPNWCAEWAPRASARSFSASEATLPSKRPSASTSISNSARQLTRHCTSGTAPHIPTNPMDVGTRCRQPLSHTRCVSTRPCDDVLHAPVLAQAAGTTEPHAPMDPDWTRDYDLPAFDLITGPPTPKATTADGKGDRVLLHAVIHVKLIGEGEIRDNPQWKPHPRWGDRFPWVYSCRLDLWVPQVADGVHTPDFAPKKAIGRICRRARPSLDSRSASMRCS